MLLFCIIIFDFGLQFAVFGAPHALLSPVAVTLGALGLCFIVLIFKNKSVVCVTSFHVFLFHLAVGSSKFDTELFLLNLNATSIKCLRFVFKWWIFL